MTWGLSFDLSTEIAGRRLGEVVEQRIRSLRPSKVPEWGRESDMAQVAMLETGPLDFYTGRPVGLLPRQGFERVELRLRTTQLIHFFALGEPSIERERPFALRSGES